MHFGLALKILRDKTKPKLDQRGFGEEIGRGRNWVGEWEKKPYPPDDWRILEIACRERWPDLAEHVPKFDDGWPPKPEKERGPKAAQETSEQPLNPQQVEVTPTAPEAPAVAGRRPDLKVDSVQGQFFAGLKACHRPFEVAEVDAFLTRIKDLLKNEEQKTALDMGRALGQLTGEIEQRLEAINLEAVVLVAKHQDLIEEIKRLESIPHGSLSDENFFELSQELQRTREQAGIVGRELKLLGKAKEVLSIYASVAKGARTDIREAVVNGTGS